MNIRNSILAIITLLNFTVLHAQQQSGRASYYSKRATGSRTASGERLHHDSLTCAHRSYPFGTMLKVTNLLNDKSVVVRVTDRGPFGRGRVIDLSWAAAQEIGMLAQGIASVKVEVVGEGGVPFKPKEEFDFPEINFEVADVGYSFIDAWKKKDVEPAKIPETRAPHPNGTAKAHKPEQQPNRETAAKRPAGTAAKPPQPANTKPSQSTNAKSPQSVNTKKKEPAVKEKKGNSWSDIFDKLKDW